MFFGEIVRKHFVKSKIESGTIKLDISGTKEDFCFFFFLVLGYTTYSYILLYISIDMPSLWCIYTKSIQTRGRGEVDYIRIKCRLLYILLKHQIYPANRKEVIL